MMNNIDRMLNVGNNTRFLENEIFRIKQIGKNNNPIAKTVRNFDSINSMWINMPFAQRSLMRQQYLDSDGDRTPDPFDCEPFNGMRQDRVTDEGWGRINKNLNNGFW